MNPERIPIALLAITTFLPQAAARQGDVLNEVRRFESNNPRAGRYGENVFLAGMRVLINLYTDDTLAPDAAIIRVFDRSAAGWTPSGTVAAEAIQSNLLADEIELKDGILVASTTRWPGPAANFGRGYVWDVVGDAFVFAGTLDPTDPLDTEAFGSGLGAHSSSGWAAQHE